MTDNDYKAALTATRKLMQAMQIQNENFIEALNYYADEANWRDISLLDRGDKAREALK